MAKEFSPKDFLRHTKSILLEQYCKNENIDYKSKKEESIDKAVERFIEIREKLDEEKKQKVDLDFRAINDMTSQSGFLNLIAEAKRQNVVLPEKEIIELDSHNASLWFFLNQSKIFDEASIRFEIEDTIGWKEIETSKKSIASFEGKDRDLSKALKDYFFTTEFKGEKCIIENYEIDDKICYVAYPEDWAEIDITYNKSGILNKRHIRKPVQKIFFLYEPSTGRLSTKAKSGWQKAKEFQKIFASSILGQNLDVDKDKVFDPNKLKDFTFTFPTPAEDKVEFVRVKSLRLSYPNAIGRRITLDVKNEKNNLEGIEEFIREIGLDKKLDQLNITQASIKIKFPSPSKRQKGTITFTLTYPNSCNLGNKPLHGKVKQYLKNWEIDNGFNNAKIIE